MSATALIAAWSASIDIGRDQAREAAVRELSDPRYAADDPNLVQRLIQWVGRRITDLLERAASVAPGGVLGLALIVLAVLGLTLALWFGGRAAWRDRRAAGVAEPLFGDRRALTADQHRALARAADDAGDLDESLREWFRACVKGLEERGILDPQPGRTADEAAREITGIFAAHGIDAVPMARTFDAVTFGGAAAAAADAAAARRLDESVTNARPAVPAP